MKTKTNPLAVGIYTIFFGLFGLNDFYFGKYKRGIFRLLSFFIPAIYFLYIQPELKISLAHKELIDNIYVPVLSEGNNALLTILRTIMLVVLIFSVLWTLLEIIGFFTKRHYKEAQTVSDRRFVLSAILLGWSGIHDFLADRSKYALFHIGLATLSLILIIVTRINFSINDATFDAYMFTFHAVGLAIAVINEIIAIIEAVNFILASKKV